MVSKLRFYESLFSIQRFPLVMESSDDVFIVVRALSLSDIGLLCIVLSHQLHHSKDMIIDLLGPKTINTKPYRTCTHSLGPSSYTETEPLGDQRGPWPLLALKKKA